MLSCPFKFFRVSERSMEPELKEGDYILVDRRRRNLVPGDKAVFMHPQKGIYMVKRIKEANNEGYFVVGTNKIHSQDSRQYGYIDRKAIVGKVIWKV